MCHYKLLVIVSGIVLSTKNKKNVRIQNTLILVLIWMHTNVSILMFATIRNTLSVIKLIRKKDVATGYISCLPYCVLMIKIENSQIF